MIRVMSIASLTLAGLTMAGCVQDSAQATNKSMSKSQVYIGALTCNVAGGTGYLIAGSRAARCLFTPESGRRPTRQPSAISAST